MQAEPKPDLTYCQKCMTCKPLQIDILSLSDSKFK